MREARWPPGDLDNLLVPPPEDVPDGDVLEAVRAAVEELPELERTVVEYIWWERGGDRYAWAEQLSRRLQLPKQDLIAAERRARKALNLRLGGLLTPW